MCVLLAQRAVRRITVDRIFVDRNRGFGGRYLGVGDRSCRERDKPKSVGANRRLLDVDMRLDDETLQRDGEKPKERHQQVVRAESEMSTGAGTLPRYAAPDMAILDHPQPSQITGTIYRTGSRYAKSTSA